MTTSFAPIDPMDAPLPGIDSAAAWRAVLHDARDGGWLRSLVTQVAAAAPDDAMLQETCQLLLVDGEPNWAARIGGLAMVGAAMVMMTAAVGGMGLTGALLALEATNHEAAVAVAEPSPPAAPAASEEGGLPGAGDHRTSAVAPKPVPTPDGGDVAGMASRVEDGPPEEPPEPGAGSLVESRRRHVKCHGRPGEAVGYFYAGRRSPGQPGDVHEVTRMVNVRVDYPHEDNGWDKRAHIHCVLSPGDRVTLSAPPVALPGDHYWVPVFDGDVEDGHVQQEVASL
jgi:hypothetical protein